MRRWWSMVIVCAAVGAALALTFSLVLPKQYTTTSRIVVGSLTDTSTDKLTAYQQLAQTYTDLISTTPSLTRIAAAAGTHEDLVQLATQINAHAPLGGTIITLDAVAGSPDEATRLADAGAAEIVRLATPSNQPSLAAVVQPAVPPVSPSSPRTFLNVVLAAFMGVVLGFLVVFAIAFQGRRQAGLDEHARVVSLLETRFGRKAG